eukprot:Stramenopile-MAST_4_protein_4817
MRSILYLLLAACLLVFAVGDAAHEEFFWGKDGEGKKPDNEPVIVDENAHPTDGTDTVDGKDDGAVSKTVDSQSNGDAKALPDLNVKAIFAAINRGEPFTGGIINNGYIDGLAVLGAEGLKVNEADIVFQRGDEDLIADIKLTLHFKRIYLTQLKLPKVGTHDYEILTRCKEGVEFKLQLRYDTSEEKFAKLSDKLDDFDMACAGEESNPTPLYVKILKAQGSKKHLVGSLLRGVVGGAINLLAKLENMNINLVNKVVDMGLSYAVIDPLNDEIANPWARETVKSLQAAGKLKAGSDAIKYIHWEVFSGRETIDVVTASSKLKDAKDAVGTGDTVTLYKPVVALKSLTYKKIKMNVRSFYGAEGKKPGALEFTLDFDGFKCEVVHSWLPRFIGKRIMGVLDLNEKRVSTRASITDDWKTEMDNDSGLNEWATGKFLNAIMPPDDPTPEETKDKSAFKKMKSFLGFGN